MLHLHQPIPMSNEPRALREDKRPTEFSGHCGMWIALRVVNRRGECSKSSEQDFSSTAVAGWYATTPYRA